MPLAWCAGFREARLSPVPRNRYHRQLEAGGSLENAQAMAAHKTNSADALALVALLLPLRNRGEAGGMVFFDAAVPDGLLVPQGQPFPFVRPALLALRLVPVVLQS